MKALIAFSFIIITLQISKAQTNDSTYQKSEDIKVVYSADAMNVLYVGFDNSISIAIAGLDSKNISATTDNGSLTRIDETKWKINPANKGRAKIKIYVLKNGVKLYYSLREFRVKSQPELIASFSGKESGDTVKREIVLKSTFLFAYYRDFLFNSVNIRVSSFTLTIGDCATPVEITNEGEKLSVDALNAISKAKNGEILIFKNIKAILPDGTTTILESIRYILIDKLLNI